MSYVLRAALPLAVAFGVMVTPVYAAGPNPVMIQIHDECNPATFNVNVNSTACIGNGAVTFAQFLSEVNQLGRAPQWQFVPGQVRMSAGQSFVVTNMGGETHTFTELETGHQFGGGIVPFLNTAAGFTSLASECTTGALDGKLLNGQHLLAPAAEQLLVPGAGFLASIVPPGGQFTDTETADDAASSPKLYQCCIHPWMHEVITVDP